jgi:hypothetical protein
LQNEKRKKDCRTFKFCPHLILLGNYLHTYMDFCRFNDFYKTENTLNCDWLHMYNILSHKFMDNFITTIGLTRRQVQRVVRSNPVRVCIWGAYTNSGCFHDMSHLQ